MKKFLIKTLIFLLPIVCLIGITLYYYTMKQGDLARMSYLKISYNHSDIFGEKFSKEPVIYVDSNAVKTRKWKFFTIGDSFTLQGKGGYVGKLSKEYPHQVLSFRNDYLVGSNPILTLEHLLMGNYFDSVKVDVVILQNVERYVLERVDVYQNDSLTFEKMNELGKQRLINLENILNEVAPPYPTNRFPHFLFNNVAYNFNSTGINHDVYKTKISKSLFSTKTQDLLFFKEDIEMSRKESFERIEKMHDRFSAINKKMEEKGMKLIVLIAPDKYDLYYPYILDKKTYKQPQFFELYHQLKKDYTYIDLFSIFEKELRKGAKDIYFYDDTHWSPFATEILVKEISKAIK